MQMNHDDLILIAAEARRHYLKKPRQVQNKEIYINILNVCNRYNNGDGELKNILFSKKI